jgi:hypothetical protein
MAKVDSAPLGTPFREMRDGRKAMRSRPHAIANDMRSTKGHMASFMANEVVQDARIAEPRERLERIERRLELREEN